MNLLEVRGVTKRFAGISALADVSLTAEAGETIGLIGPNGAGKTTLFDCLCGILAPDSGRVLFSGQDITRLPVHRRARLGIGRTFQRSELWSGMTVRDHLLVVEAVRRGRGGLLWDLLRKGRPNGRERSRANETLELLGLFDDADRPVEAVGLGRGRLVELGRALESDPRLLLLDEPSSGLDRDDTLALGAIIGEVQQARGTTFVLVEHDLEMVRRFTQRLYVLHAGRLIASGPTAEVLADESVRRAYLGGVAP